MPQETYLMNSIIIEMCYIILVIDVKTAIPMVMGANIGTSMTSTLVSLTHMTDAKQVITSLLICYATTV